MPPLSALRAFEATARHLSVKNAAEELCVTPGAVSQMLKALELHLGVKLFHRVNRGIFLTDAGQGYLPPVRNAFRQIAEATRRITVSADTGILTVSVTPFFAAAWLVPRLKEFQDAHPDIDLQVVTSNALVDFSRDGVDVAVRHGLGRYPGLCSERVVAVEIVPVAAPTLVAKLGAPTAPAELTRWPHVHDAERKGWHLWFQAQGIDDIGAPRGPAFDDSGLLLKAVTCGSGRGFAAGRHGRARACGRTARQARGRRVARGLRLLSRLPGSQPRAAEGRRVSHDGFSTPRSVTAPTRRQCPAHTRRKVQQA